ncbi:zinc-dependent alcohol dehydrogenase [Oceanobacillus alkalisoli]|uniref:zinc-dependent alcohol dehydrogenase n=1 Tax=Oceanobacillus alkalisoli TaxID=2925113 RepID=UPI001EE4DA11|nr:zinc-binding dehydrogenase [Oceanobacillus alkalisoli]MCG5102501.1 zinc-binding dehydrogenase [Oceanobacillus alkalisoli]
MSDEMKFAVLTKVKNAEVHTRALPNFGEYELVIQQQACNICTTDYGQWLGLREHQPYPMAGGHEVSGVIVKRGQKVREDLQIGDYVAVTHSFCGRCEQCLLGFTSDCEQKKKTMNKIPSSDGYYGNFGFSNYSVRDEKFLVKMNPNLSASEAGFLEPAATVVKGIRKLRVTPMEKVVVIGAGTMGLLNALIAQAYGAQVIITEIMQKKIAIARSMGFEVIDASKNNPVKSIKELTNGKGVDAVIVAVGVTIANQQALEMVKQFEGRISFFAAGYPNPKLEIDSNIIHYRKIELIGTYGADIADFYHAGRLLNERIINISPLIEEKVPLDNIQKAFEKASTLGNYRISVLLT